jgi:hypothetical protein
MEATTMGQDIEKKQVSSEAAKETQNPLADLEVLVEELIKDKPNLSVVKPMMLALGLPFNEDPIFQLNTVLQALHGPVSNNQQVKVRGKDANLQ